MGEVRIVERANLKTCLGFELVLIRANVLTTLTFVGPESPIGLAVLDKASEIATRNLLLYKAFGLFEGIGWVSGTEFATGCSLPHEVPASQVDVHRAG